MAIILEKRYRIKRKKMKDEKYVNSGIATLDAANITFDDFEMPFPLQKMDIQTVPNLVFY